MSVWSDTLTSGCEIKTSIRASARAAKRMKIACNAKSEGVLASTTILSSRSRSSRLDMPPKPEGTGGTGGGEKDGRYGVPPPKSLPASEL